MVENEEGNRFLPISYFSFSILTKQYFSCSVLKAFCVHRCQVFFYFPFTVLKKACLLLKHYIAKVWRRQNSVCVWGVGVVVAERDEALTNQT